MNFLRSISKSLKDKKSKFQYAYLRNSDSKVLKSSEFKNLVPFVSVPNHLTFALVSEEDNSLKLRLGYGAPKSRSRLRFPIPQGREVQPVHPKVHL